MKFLIEHTFEGLTPEGYEEVFFDEPFNVALGEALGLGRQLRRLDRAPGRIVRHVCCEPSRDPDSPAGKAFGSSRASFVEELEYDLRAHAGTWRTIPSLLPERVKTSGTLEVLAVGGGVRRVVRGEVKASLWGFGGLVERHVVAEIVKSYDRSAAFTVTWLASRS
jgi:hypothetical protein